MSTASIPSHRLHNRTLIENSVVTRHTTLFPFFDHAGAVRWVLVVCAGSPVLSTLDLGAVALRIPFIGKLCITSGRSRKLDEQTLGRLSCLWHFDPWWLLEHGRYHGNTATPLLKATNCVDRFEGSVGRLHYSPDLRRVVRVSNDEQSKPFEPELLPARPQAVPVNPPAGWRLDPFWV